MDTKAIETLAINAVKNSVVTSNYLDQYIADNDKEPSWDGFVYIYNNSCKGKESLLGRVPVQVKGHEKSDFSKTEISHPIDMPDLRNYLYDGGVALFVVYVNSFGEAKIYYKFLMPLQLRDIIEDAKDQGTKNIRLRNSRKTGIERPQYF